MLECAYLSSEVKLPKRQCLFKLKLEYSEHTYPKLAILIFRVAVLSKGTKQLAYLGTIDMYLQHMSNVECALILGDQAASIL